MTRQVNVDKAELQLKLLYPFIKIKIEDMAHHHSFAHDGKLELSYPFFEFLLEEVNPTAPIKIKSIDQLKRIIKILFYDYYFTNYGSGLWMDIISDG